VGDTLPQTLTLENFHVHYRALARVALAAAQKALVRPDLYPDAEEAASDAMLAAARRVQTGNPIDNPAAFVTRWAQWRATDSVRHKRREQELIRELISHGVLPIGSTEQGGGKETQTARAAKVPDPAEVALLAERLQLARQRMSENQRLCFDWHDLGRLSQQAVAQLLGLKVGTVKSHLDRAREIVSEEFK
jgi:RNA polymerase sigma factor (sigma-70 family)